MYISSVITSTFTCIRHWSLSEAELHAGQVTSLSRPLTHDISEVLFSQQLDIFFFSSYDHRDVVGKKIPVYLSLWNTEVLLYSGRQTCEPISRRRTFDQRVESAVIKDVSRRRAEPLLHHQLLCAGLEMLNVGRRNIWHLCGGRLCNVPDNNTRVLGICNPISKASESPQPAIFFITLFFFSWSVSVFFFFLNPLGLMTVVRSYICFWYEILIMWPHFCTYLNLIFILEIHFSI